MLQIESRFTRAITMKQVSSTRWCEAEKSRFGVYIRPTIDSYPTMSADLNDDRPTDAKLPFVISVRDRLREVDRTLESWLAKHSVSFLRYALAMVFFWFGIVKPFGVSPADPVVETGIYFLPFDLFFPVLGWWEALVGVGLLFERTVKFAVYLMVFQMLGTMIPLFTAPGMTFVDIPFVPTAVGAYIIKNWVLLSGGLVVLAMTELEGER